MTDKHTCRSHPGYTPCRFVDLDLKGHTTKNILAEYNSQLGQLTFISINCSVVDFLQGESVGCQSANLLVFLNSSIIELLKKNNFPVFKCHCLVQTNIQIVDLGISTTCQISCIGCVIEFATLFKCLHIRTDMSYINHRGRLNV